MAFLKRQCRNTAILLLPFHDDDFHCSTLTRAMSALRLKPTPAAVHCQPKLYQFKKYSACVSQKTRSQFFGIPEIISEELTSSFSVFAKICLHIEFDTVPLFELPVNGAVRHVRVIFVVEKLLKQYCK